MGIARRCALAIALLLPAAGHADDFSIFYHERPGALSIAPDVTSKSSAVQSARPADDSILSFTAFGRSFRARLEPNGLLLRGLPPNARSTLSGIEVFRGELVDVPNSWVRLTRVGREISGAIFDGIDIFAIDSAVRLAPSLKSPEPVPYTGPIVYRWRDTSGTLTDELRGMVATGSTQAPAALALAAGVLDPGRRLDLGLVADAEYNHTVGSGAAGEALRSANLLDGILVFELGVHVNVAELTVFSQEPDPFTAMEPVALLHELEEYRATTPVQQALDVTHLLTGRSFSTDVIGTANLGGVCDARLGAGLTQTPNPGTLRDAIVMAHELGHNFGAPHDGALGTPCESTPLNYIMAPRFNGSQQFSQCSIEQMRPKLGAACLDVLAPADVELRTLSVPTDAIVGETFQIKVALDNPSAADAAGVEMLIDGTNLTFVSLSNTVSVTCSIAFPAEHASCRKRVLSSGESAIFEITARAMSVAPATVSVVVRSLSDPDPTDNAATYTIAARPIVKLVAEVAPAPEFVRVGQLVDYSVTVRNDGTMTATNARALITIPWQVVNTLSVATGASTCPVVADQYVCQFGSLAPGEARPVSLRLRAIDSLAAYPSVTHVQGWVQIQPVADQQNHWTFGYRNLPITVATSIVDLQTTAPRNPLFILNKPVEFSFSVTNVGPDVAADVVLVNVGFAEHGLIDGVVTSDFATCQVPAPSTLAFRCRVPTLAVGQTFVVTIRGTASRLGLFLVAAQTEVGAYDPVADNNEGRSSYSIVTEAAAQPPTPTPPPPPPAAGGTTASPASSGGGGGGAADRIWLALLVLALAARRPWAARASRI